MAEVIALFDPVGLDRELVRRGGLHAFVRAAWSQIESQKFVDNWHIHEMCTHLEACQRREIRKLIINVPPGHSKSLVVSALYPVWCWIQDPTEKFICVSYEASLSRRDAKRMRDLINSPWFQDRWGASTPNNISIPFASSRRAGEFESFQHGLRYSTSIGGGMTGRHATQHIVDDPIKPKDTMGGADVTRKHLDACEDFWRATLSTRVSDASKIVQILIMQRLHDADLAGRLLEENPPPVHLMLPMRFEPKRKCVTKWGGDRRTEEGELLNPKRYDETAVTELEIKLAQFASAQLQQDPVPPGGNIFKLEWLQNYWTDAILPPLDQMQLLQSWDMRFKDSKTTGDWVVGQVWGAYKGLFYLLDQVRGRWSFVETCEQVIALTAKHPRAYEKLIEDKANGSAVMSALQGAIPGIVPVEPEGGKEARANAAQPVFKSANVLPPNPVAAPWVLAWQTEMTRFPKAPHDDQVDATTQAITRLMLSQNWLGAAMAKAQASPDLMKILTG